jgi:hypothetical protein
MLLLPTATIVLILKKEELTNFLRERNALRDGEVAVEYLEVQAMVTKLNVSDVQCRHDMLSVFLQLFAIAPMTEVPADLFAGGIEVAKAKYPDRLVFAHCLHIDAQGKRLRNTSAPSFVDATISHIIDLKGVRSLVEVIRKVCEPEFVVEHEGYKNIRILPRS